MTNNQQENQDVAMIEHLVEALKVTNATSGHATFDPVFGEDSMTAVISVYNESQPSHMILDKLVDWLEETNQTEVLDKIQALEEDNSWRNS